MHCANAAVQLLISKKNQVLEAYKHVLQSFKAYKQLQTKFEKLNKNKGKKRTIEDTINDLNINNNKKNVCKLLFENGYFYSTNDKTLDQCLFYESATTYKYR